VFFSTFIHGLKDDSYCTKRTKRFKLIAESDRKNVYERIRIKKQSESFFPVFSCKVKS